MFFSKELDYVSFLPLQMVIMSGLATKKSRLIEDVRVFQKYWTEKFGVIEKDNRALCIFCFETVVCRTSSVERHFERIHDNINNKTEEEKRELINSKLSKTKKQADKFMNFISGRSSSNLVAASFEVSKVIAQHGKPLSDEIILKKLGWNVHHFFLTIFQKKKRLFSVLKIYL